MLMANCYDGLVKEKGKKVEKKTQNKGWIFGYLAT